eukprot:676305-Alexandrium_andersonii.AAC.1
MLSLNSEHPQPAPLGPRLRPPLLRGPRCRRAGSSVWRGDRRDHIEGDHRQVLRDSLVLEASVSGAAR